MRPLRMFLAAAGAALVAGSLDIMVAAIVARSSGDGPMHMLETIASGPFGSGAFVDIRFAAVGLAVHFAIMGVMALAYMILADRVPAIQARPLLSGAACGLLLWAIMYLVVRPLRWPGQPLPGAQTIVSLILVHVVLVGMPIALIQAWAARGAARVSARGATSVRRPSAAGRPGPAPRP